MKTNVKFLALAVVATALAYSCVKEEIAEENIKDNQDKTEVEITGQVFEAVMENTKSTLVDKTPTWAEEDVIALFGNGSESAVQLTYAGENKFQTAAGVTVEGPYYAIYPYDENHTVDQTTGIFTATVPAEQTIAQGQNVAAGALASVAYSEGTQLYFRNAVSLIRIENKREDIVSIKIESTNAEQMLAGSFTMDLNPDKETEGEAPAVTAVAETGIASITLKPAEENGTFASGELYAAVLPTTLDGIKVTFERKVDETKNETATVTKTADLELKRNGGADLGSFFTYEIKNADDLLAWNKAAAKWTAWDVVTLTDNIDCKDVINSENWTPNEFTGTFDGNDKTIDNFVIEKAGPAAFLGKLSGNAVVRDLTFGEGCSFTSTGVSDGSIVTTGRVYAAALACEVRGNAGMDNITNYAAITGNHAGVASKGNYIAGICASLGGAKATVSNCKNYGNVTFSAAPVVWTCVGGIFGESPKTETTITNCQNYGTILFNGPSNGGASINLAGIAGGANKVSFDGCSNFGKVEYNAQEAAGGGINIGGIVGHNNSAAIPSLTNCTNGSATDNTLGEIVVSGATGGEIRMGGCVGYVQEVATIISGFKNYGKLSNSVSTAGTISMGGVVGRVYKTTNTITSCENNGTITNAAKTITTAYMGGLVGWVNTANTSISNASNKGAVTNSATAASTLAIGGICGEIDNTTDNSISICENHGTITNTGTLMTAYMGGMVGWLQNANTSLDNVSNGGAVTNNGAVTNTKTSGAITYIRLGGIVGYAQGGTGHAITNATNTVTIKNTKGGNSADIGNSIADLGGIVGKIDQSDLTIGNDVAEGVKNSGAILNEGQNTDNGLGGIVGSITAAANANTIQNCINSGRLYRNGWVNNVVNGHGFGGILGYHFATGAATLNVSNSKNTGTVEKLGGAGSNHHIAGIVGSLISTTATCTISGCTNEGNITYANGTESGGGSMANNRYCYTAGIVGHHNSKGEIINCTNSGIITNKLGTSAATGIRIGGIVGNLVYANMTKCKNTSEVKDESTSPGGYVGGVAGWISTTKITLTDCDNAATVSAKFGSESRSTKVNRSTVYIGGIAGGCNSEIILDGCDNTANVINNCPSNTATAKTAVAGVIGFCNSHTTMTNCTTSGNVTNNCNDTKNEYFGGLAGQIENNKTTKITGCTVTANLTVKVTTRDANHFSGILVGRLTDKVDGSGADATVSTTIQNVTVKGGSYNGTALTAENLGTYTFGHASNYGGKLYTKGGSYATTGITYAE